MLGFFPELQPEELFYSAAARYSALLDYPGAGAGVAEDLFGLSKIKPTLALPTRLASFAESLSYWRNSDLVSLINRHTLFPYFSRFVETPKATRVFRLMAQDRKGHFLLPYFVAPASRVVWPTWLQFCVHCAEADYSRAGMMAWRRAHQLPGVFVCPSHGEWLRKTRVRASRLTAFTALDRMVMQNAAVVPRLTVAKDILLRIASASQWLLENPCNGSAVVDRRRTLRKLLVYAGWTRTRKLLRTLDIASSIERYYSASTLAIFGCSLRTKSNYRYGNWVARMLQSDTSRIAPLHYLLLLEFAGVTVGQFFSDVAESEIASMPRTSWPCASGALQRNRRVTSHGSVCANRICSQFDVNWVSTLVAQRLTPGQYSFRCVDCEFTYGWNPKFPRRRRILSTGRVWDSTLARLLADSRCTAKAAARHLGVQIATVQRHAQRLGIRDRWARPARITPRKGRRRLRALAAHKAKWIALRAANAGLGRTALQGLAKGTYLFLRQHDPQWIEANSPSRRMILTQ
jgi:hypothetical protein